jgi:diguanylate cyclase (GGDEF)-like protein
VDRQEDRDRLTGLVRAGTFQARLDSLCLQSERKNNEGCPPYVVGLVDIVGLRHVNRDLGSDAGDELLRQVAERLEAWPHVTLVARIGPDEFALLAEGVDAEDSGQWARAVRSRVLGDPFELNGAPIEVSFTVSRREGPPPPGWDLLWQLQREASADATRELHQRLAALERNMSAADKALRENDLLRTDLVQLRDLAYRDPLTGLLNRRGMYDRLAELAASGAWGALAFVDLDNLRELNDGDELWEDGDQAIAGVAERLDESFGTANVGRWGGDEYLVVAPMVSVGQAGERLKRILQVCRRELVVSGRPITFSAGVVACEFAKFDAARDLAERAVKEAKDRRATVKVIPSS